MSQSPKLPHFWDRERPPVCLRCGMRMAVYQLKGEGCSPRPSPPGRPGDVGETRIVNVPPAAALGELRERQFWGSILGEPAPAAPARRAA